MDLNMATIGQRYHWGNLRQNVCAHIKVSKTINGNTVKIKYGNFPRKEQKEMLWDRSSVDIIGPNRIRRKFSNTLL